MPYIPRVDRHQAQICPVTAGQLNYAITSLIVGYLRRKGTSYQTINDIVGALVASKDEFTRRVITPYEDDRIRTNSDVYPNQGGEL